MARQQNPNSGFTMMEMMLTLAVVSILLMLTVQSAPQNNAHTVDREVDNIAFFFQLAQTNALNTKQAHVVEFDRTKHRIVIKSGYGETLETYTLNTCKILQGGLSGFLYKSNGDTNAFGTIRFHWMDETGDFGFQVQEGRVMSARRRVQGAGCGTCQADNFNNNPHPCTRTHEDQGNNSTCGRK